MKKQNWLETSLKLVSKHGIGILKVNMLSKELKVTKGSFYHHFKSHGAFIEEILEYWYKTFTKDSIDKIKQLENNPMKQIELLDNIIYSKDLNIEIEFRAWRLRNKLVLAYMEKIDNERVLLIESILSKINPNNDKKTNENIAIYIYCQFIGSLFIQPRITQVKQKELDNFFFNLIVQKEK